MKSLKTFLMAVAGIAMLTACFNDKGYNAGILFERPQQRITPLYANTVSDSIILFSYGSWAISNDGLNTWATIPVMQGEGNKIYAFPVTFKENLTGEGRTVSFIIKDTEHPDEAYSSFGYLQYATRGNGALGTAADVRRISGSDGSEVVIDYDAQHRPLTIKMSKGEEMFFSQTFSYDDLTMTIGKGSSQIKVLCGNDYQPGALAMENDTMTYLAHHYNYIDIPYTEIFTYSHARKTGDNLMITYNLHGQNLMADSLHNADSLTYYVNQEMVEDFAIEYSNKDNRCQSVDVNQLLLGIDMCDPYLLLGLYRYARNTSIISMAKKPDADIIVTTTLNADKSVATLSVRRQEQEIVYTFEY